MTKWNTPEFIAQVMSHRAQCKTIAEIAVAVGATPPTVSKLLRLYDPKPRKPKPVRRPRGYNKKTDRNEQMIALRKQGKTLPQLAEQFGITRERVRQVVKGIKFVRFCRTCGHEFQTAFAEGAWCSAKCRTQWTRQPKLSIRRHDIKVERERHRLIGEFWCGTCKAWKPRADFCGPSEVPKAQTCRKCFAARQKRLYHERRAQKETTSNDHE